MSTRSRCVAEFKIEKKYGVKDVLIISYQYIGTEKEK